MDPATARTSSSTPVAFQDGLGQRRLSVSVTNEPLELFATLPESFGARAALRASFLLYAERGIEVETLAVVPLADELPPPPPKPWKD